MAIVTRCVLVQLSLLALCVLLRNFRSATPPPRVELSCGRLVFGSRWPLCRPPLAILEPCDPSTALFVRFVAPTQTQKSLQRYLAPLNSDLKGDGTKQFCLLGNLPPMGSSEKRQRDQRGHPKIPWSFLFPVKMCISYHIISWPPWASQGTLHGTWSSGVAAFRGIRYGEAPLGRRRWRPAAAACSGGMATMDGERCMQGGGLNESEDSWYKTPDHQTREWL